MACDHFPVLDTLDLPGPILENYARLTHPDHPHAARYRQDLESWARDGRFARAVAPVPIEDAATVVRPFLPRAETPTASPPRQAMTKPYFERLAIVQECDHRGEQVQSLPHEDGTRGTQPGGCGCTRTWHCAAGRGTFRSNPFHVALGECLACVAINGLSETEAR